jgi:hypothetical protein
VYEQFSRTSGDEVLYEEKMPNWRQRIALGLNATTPFSAEKRELLITDGYEYTRRWCNHSAAKSWSSEERTGDFIGTGLALPSAPSTDEDSNVNARALMNFVKAARQAQGSFRGSVFSVELAEALRMIRNPAKALRDGIDRWSSLARRRLKQATGRDPLGTRVRDLSKRQRAAANRALSESWLETQFGWLPLVSDIEDGYHALRKWDKRQDRKSITGFADDKSQTDSGVVTRSSRNINFTWRYYTFTESYVRYYGAVKVRTSTLKSRVIEESGFRFRDFVPALWEWIPYSFVVDYFTNVGEVIEAACFPRSDMAWVGKVFRNTRIRDCTRCQWTKSNNLNLPLTNTIEVDACIPSTQIWRRKYIRRVPYTGSLVPTFQWEIPGMKNWKRYLNMAALVHLRRGMRR